MGADTSVDAIHAGERIPTLEAIGDQAIDLHNQPVVDVTCPCGATGPLRAMYRCYYCEVVFCPGCADEHFDESNR